MPNGSPAARKSRPKSPVTVFKVTGETNTDDLSPAQDAWSRPDIPLHALAMLKNARDGINPTAGHVGPIKQIEALKKPKATSSPTSATWWVPVRQRKSATNSVLWFTAPTSRSCRTSATAVSASAARSPRSSTTPWKTPAPCRSSATCPNLNMGDVIDVYPYDGKITHQERRDEVAQAVRTEDRRAAGRSARRRPHQPDHRPRPDHKAREALGLPLHTVPPTAAARRHRQGLHPRAEDGRQAPAA
jgi:aconitate hydratase 2/2-methylisocitrate dehydratase